MLKKIAAKLGVEDVALEDWRIFYILADGGCMTACICQNSETNTLQRMIFTIGKLYLNVSKKGEGKHCKN